MARERTRTSTRTLTRSRTSRAKHGSQDKVIVYLYHWERQSFVTIAQEPFIMGRSGAVYSVMDDPVLSRKHCQVERYQGRVVVRDLESQNGTWVNGIKVSSGQVKPIFDGDWLLIGDQSFFVTFTQSIPDSLKLFALKKCADLREHTIQTWIARKKSA